MGTFRVFPAVAFFCNHETKNNGLIHCFWPFRFILTGLLLVQKYTQLETGWFNYDLFLARWDQIRMYLSPLCIYTIYLTSIARNYCYPRFTTWWFIINHNSHNKLYLPWCGILSESLILFLLFQFGSGHWIHRKRLSVYSLIMTVSVHYIEIFHCMIYKDLYWILTPGCRP